MRKLLTILFVFFTSYTLAQNPLFIDPTREDADSLQKILRNPPNDTIAMASCRGLAIFYLEVNVDSSGFFSNKALELSRKLKLKLWEVDALDLNAIVLSRLGEYSKSLEYFMQAIKLGSDPKTEQNIWRSSAGTYSGNTIFARKSMLAAVYLDLGELYVATNFHDKAFAAFRKSLLLAAEIVDYTLPSVVYGSMADSYLSLNKLDSAKIVIQMGLAYGDSAGYYKYRGNDYTRLGTVALRLGIIDEAKDYFLKGLSWSIEQKNLINEAETYIWLSRMYFSEGDLDSSYFYAQKGLTANQNTYFKDGILQSNEQLYEIHKALNQQDSAFFYLEKSKVLSDSINAEEKMKRFQNIGFEEQLRAQELETAEEDYNNRLRLNALLGSTFTLIVIAGFLFRNSRQKQKAKLKIEKAYSELKSTQSQLIQSEKMASLGELTAGIAHEIQNPLNFVNNFAEVSKELAEELNEEVLKTKIDTELISDIAGDLVTNQEKINHHGQRASGIVKGMLEHSRTSTGKKELTDINKLADEYLRLAYHGMRAKDKSFNSDFKLELDETIPKLNVIPQDIGRVLLNLINNAFYAVNSIENPSVTVSTKVIPLHGGVRGGSQSIQISVKDNGPGIPAEIKDKIFQPFFTTKPTGSGTGLGLSLAYDIITKGHNGHLEVETEEGIGTRFIVQLPST